MYVKLSSMPDPPKEYVLELPRLDGGLNLWDLDYRMDANQSPNMQNLYWLDGALSCRDGQAWLSEAQLGAGYCCAPELFWDHAFFHIGSKLYYGALSDPAAETMTLTELLSGVPANRGTWLRYGDDLF